MARILGAGLIAVDHLFRSGRAVGRVGAVEYLGTMGGGSVGNALSMLSVLGHSAHVTGVVGDDFVANLVRTDFGKVGVDASRLVVRSGRRKGIRTRQFSHLVYPSGKHSFRDQCMQCGSSFGRELVIRASDVSSDLLTFVDRCDLLHVDRANGFTLKLAERALSKAVPISFDMAFKPYGKGEKNLERMLSIAKLVKVPQELFTTTDKSPVTEGLLEWREKYPNISDLFVTRGPEGILGYCQVGTEKQTFLLPAFVARPYHDGGGAGDVLVASLIERFLLESPPETQQEVRTRVNEAQGLASFSCTMYGARSLAHVLRAQGIEPAGIWELARHVVEDGTAKSRWSAKTGISWRSSLGFLFGTNHACTVCGLARKEKKASRPRRRRLEYHVSLGQAPLAMIESYQIGKAHHAELREFRGQPTVFVGSGGSLSAAAFAESVTWRLLGVPSRAMPPYEFASLPKIDAEVALWLLSYGGTNPDILAAAQRARELRVRRCIVLTGAKNSQLAEMAREWKWRLVVLPGQQRSFVATVGMLAMLSAIAAIFSNENGRKALGDYLDYPNLLEVFVGADKIARERAALFPSDLESVHLIGLSSGWGWPALVDFESKVVEGGLCTVEIAELKNFTHGRYIGALERRKKNRLIILRTPENSELADFIERKLRRHISLAMVSTDLRGPAGAIDLVVKVLFLAAHLARKVGKDISNPEYPSEARGLYGWSPSGKTPDDHGRTLQTYGK